jgi:RecB family endonuclease NucS
MGNPINLDWEDIKKSEKHFQAFILQNLQIENNNFYPEIFGKNIVWIGNEVFAGSGMQKIDIMTIERINETSYLFRIIELKHPKSEISSSVSQLEYYINWAREDIGVHVRGAYRFNIKPILLVLTKNFGIVQRDIINFL